MLQFNGVHHIAVIASDAQRSREFYTGVLGLRVVRETFRQERGSWKIDLEGQGLAIELFTFPGAPARLSRPEAMGLRHLALRVGDIHAAVAQITAAGAACEPVRTDDLTGKRFTFFADPDGLPIEVYEHSKDAGNGLRAEHAHGRSACPQSNRGPEGEPAGPRVIP
jgi:glyoxylase I family protein